MESFLAFVLDIFVIKITDLGGSVFYILPIGGLFVCVLFYLFKLDGVILLFISQFLKMKLRIRTAIIERLICITIQF